MYQWDAGSGETISGATQPTRQNSSRLNRLSNRLSNSFVNRLSPSFANQTFPADSRYPTVPQNDLELQLSPRTQRERHESMEHELRHSLSQATFLASPHEVARVSEESQDPDLEKGKPQPQAEGGFDLREYLTSSNDAYDEAGIKHKHVGVSWENLSVDVIGAEGMKFYAENLAG